MIKKTKNQQKSEELDYPNNIAALIALYEQQIKDIMALGVALKLTDYPELSKR
jgi:hypothetical protein